MKSGDTVNFPVHGNIILSRNIVVENNVVECVWIGKGGGDEMNCFTQPFILVGLERSRKCDVRCLNCNFIKVTVVLYLLFASISCLPFYTFFSSYFTMWYASLILLVHSPSLRILCSRYVPPSCTTDINTTFYVSSSIFRHFHEFFRVRALWLNIFYHSCVRLH